MDTKKTMEAIDVYIMYCAMKAHFSRKDYDFHKYGGKTKVSRDSFWKRKDRFFFVKLSKKYKTEIEIRNYFEQFVIEMKPFIKEFEPLFEVKNSSHPKLLKEFLGSRVSLETMLVLDELVSFSKKWDQQLEDDIVWVDLKKLMKNYKGFLTINKNRYRIKLLKLIEESN